MLMFSLAVLLCPGQTTSVVFGGQSLSVYSDDGVASTTQTRGNKMPTGNTVNASTLAFESTVTSWPLIDLVEANYETPRHGFADFFQSVTGTSILAVHCGVTASSYQQLKRGTAPFTNCERGLEAFGARNINETVLGFVVVHGESDRLSATYEADLVSWQNEMQSKVQEVTETIGDVPIYVSQIASCTKYNLPTLDTCLSPMETYWAAKNNPGKVMLIGPRYQFTYAADGIHWGKGPSKAHGAMAAKVVAAGASWEPLWPTAVTLSGNVVDVTFHVPVQPLVLDTTLVTNPGDYGFSYTCGSSPPAISSVALLDADTVRITLGSTPSGACQTDDTIRYAYTGTSGASAGRATGMRGNLRDSDTATWGGVPLYNWGVHFSEVVQ